MESPLITIDSSKEDGQNNYGFDGVDVGSEEEVVNMLEILNLTLES